MKCRKSVIGIFNVLCLLCLSPLVWAHVLSAGAATQFISEVTPAHDRLEVNALVLSDGATTLAFCACDTRGLDDTLLYAVEARLVAAGSHIPPGHLMLSATHTHTGGFSGVMPGALQQMAYGTFARANVENASDAICRCVSAAESALCPAKLTFGEASAQQYAVNRSDPRQGTDAILNALYVQRLDGTPLAFLVNYAAHPTILFRTEYSEGRDFPAGVEARIRQAYSAPIPVLYLNGDLGDVAPNPPPGDTPLRQAILMGERLGAIALTAVQAATPQVDVTLRARCRTIPMPPALSESLAPREGVLQDFSFGGALFLSLPGEVTTPIGLALRAEAQKVGVRHTFLCGLTSSYNGYYPDATEYFRAQYESQMDLYGAELTGWFLKNLFPDEQMTQEQCWQSDPLLNAHFATFRAAYARGRLHQRVIRKHWARTRMQIHGVIDTMKRFKVMPAAVKSYEKFVDRDGLKMLGTAFFSYLAREQLVTSMTDEQRVTMMGLADGAQLPLDALMIEQYLRHPRNLPHIARFVLGLTGVTGSDLLARYGSAVPPKYARHSKVRQAHKKFNAESESIS